MSRARLVVSAALGVVALAAALAAALVWLKPAASALGPVPAAAFGLPGDAPFLMGLDVKRLVASPFYRKQAAGGAARLDAFREIQEKTGLDPERDVDAIVFAGAPGGGARRGVAVVLGRFDASKLEPALGQRAGAASTPYAGVSLHTFTDAGGARALGIVDAGTILIGDAALVKAFLDDPAGVRRGVPSKPDLAARLRRVKPGVTFWLVGDESVLRDLPRTLPAPGFAGGAGGSLSLPALQGVVASADFDPQVAVDVTGDTADEAAARNLADVLRGLIALFNMQAARQPGLEGLGSAFNVSQTGASVSVSARLPPELLEALRRGAPAASAPGTEVR